jgi:hypothetical protein
MKSLFLISSAIYTPYGKFSTKERIRQTQETISSIKTYAPKSNIILLDAGERSLDIDFGSDIEIIDCSKHISEIEFLLEYLKSGVLLNPDSVIKSLLEIVVFDNYFNFIYKNKEYLKYNRIFKISGRYKLNSNFDYFLHLNKKNKVLFSNPCISQYSYNISFKNKLPFLQYMSRLWSFDSNILSDICVIYNNMKKDIFEMIQNKDHGDIEHFLYKNLNKNLVFCVDKIGVEGFVASSGKFINE